MHSYYEFFAGGGMANAGLGSGWRCSFANDFDEAKARAYRANWGDEHLHVADVKSIEPSRLPGQADLAWASFPCQDLSLAGDYAGLNGQRSGTFWPFWNLMRSLQREGRGPKSIILENVFGAVTSRGGKDFAAIASAFSGAGYRFGAMIIDARHFLPQSRPRLFVVGIRGDIEIPSRLISPGPIEIWHPDALMRAHEGLSARAKKLWVWWNLPKPTKTPKRLSDIIEDSPTGVEWHSPEETKYILSLMSKVHLRKVEEAQKAGRKVVGTIYRRTRPDENGTKRQRAEIRFDEVAGCLRTPSGGSSRQSIMVVDGRAIRSRLLSPREAARLMGLPDSYKLPTRYNDAYHLAGDGVAVPVVRHIAKHILEPVLAMENSGLMMAAD